jgi:hypothetical protein
MATELEVVNQALRLLGDDPLTQAEWAAQTLRRAQLAYQYLTSARKTTLTEYPWDFATVYDTLDPDAVAPPWGYTYRYEYPALALRVLITEDDTTFKRVGPWLYSNEATLNISYIEDVTDWTLFPEHFASAVAAALALKMCEGDTGKGELWKRLTDMYRHELTLAKAIEGHEGRPPTEYTSTLVEDR